MTEDADLSKRYREVPAEEPPRALDEAILAAARRAVRARPAPLVAPSGRSHWYVPLAAAAVIVLAVAITLHMQEPPPGEEVVVQRDQPAAAKTEPPRAFEAAKSPPVLQERQAPDERRAAEPALGAARESARSDAEARRSRLAAPLRREAASGTAENFWYASPEQWLQGIADLRRQSRDDEADRQLAEFRKRYPDYRIPKEMLERLEMPK